MNTHHTPGPWEVTEVENGHVILMGPKARDGALIHPQRYLTFDHGLLMGENRAMDRQYAEAWANAHLIAAAPDLLAALMALFRVYRGLLGDRPTRANEPRILAQARDAITKATGEEP